MSRGHAIQYHSLPDYRWDRLRKERPGEYEQPVDPAPDPNTWFRVRIVVADSTVNVFVADATRSCLTIRKLNSRTTGLVGLWVGNYSGGDFANLDIAPT